MNRPVYFEILADAPQKLASFYQAVLGWETRGGDGGRQYWRIDTGSDKKPGINGGLMHRHFPQPVINTVEVDDLGPVLERVVEEGGKVVHGPQEIPDVGLHAYCSDPEGNLFGLLEPRSEE